MCLKFSCGVSEQFKSNFLFKISKRKLIVVVNIIDKRHSFEKSILIIKEALFKMKLLYPKRRVNFCRRTRLSTNVTRFFC